MLNHGCAAATKSSVLSTEATGGSAVPEIQPWVVAGRIAAIIGMGLSISLAILFLLGALWLPGTVAAILAVPFFVMMVAIERSKAAKAMTGKPPTALEP
jgi:hypothetical protein